MQQVIKYTAKTRLFIPIRDEDDLFYQLVQVDYLTLEHDLEMDDRVERLVKNLLHLMSEFVNYLHRPTVRYNDQMLKRDLMMDLLRLKWKKLQLAGRIQIFSASESVELKVMQLVLLPIDYPTISVDRHEFDDDEAQPQVLFPISSI